ncbi:MAG: hypothetical protein IFK91_09600 [Acidobacteria bacterium]|nr:hypothetical protein [Candidatus Sulfomarinibacter sp. MAG AM1]
MGQNNPYLPPVGTALGDSFRDVPGNAELQLGILGVSEQGPAQRVHPGFVWL